jgi:hypothetical protein
MTLSPIKLLTRGGALRGSKDRPGVYRLAKNALPKFSAPSPFASAPTLDPEPAQGALFAPAEPDPEADTELVTAPTPAPAPPPSPSPLHDSLKPAAPKAISPWRRWFGRWFTKPRQPRVVSVQTELALARVTVVRNDLSEDDLEVAPAPQGPVNEQNAGEANSPEAAP